MSKIHRPTVAVLFLAIVSALLATGCNTTRGIGRDVERAGEKIQETAR